MPDTCKLNWHIESNFSASSSLYLAAQPLLPSKVIVVGRQIPNYRLINQLSTVGISIKTKHTAVGHVNETFYQFAISQANAPPREDVWLWQVIKSGQLARDYLGLGRAWRYDYKFDNGSGKFAIAAQMSTEDHRAWSEQIFGAVSRQTESHFIGGATWPNGFKSFEAILQLIYFPQWLHLSSFCECVKRDCLRIISLPKFGRNTCTEESKVSVRLLWHLSRNWQSTKVMIIWTVITD